jgi:hypothetical protein
VWGTAGTGGEGLCGGTAVTVSVGTPGMWGVL